MKKSLFLAVFLIVFTIVSVVQAAPAQYFGDIPVVSIKNTVSADGGGGGGTSQSGAISGKITDENGVPIPSAYVYAYHWNGQYCDTGYYSSVDSEGNYSISPLPGEYIVAAYAWDNYYGEVYPDDYTNNYCNSNAEKITVTECNETCTVALVNFSLLEKPVTTNIWINSGQEIQSAGGEVGYSVSLTNKTGERKRVVVTVTLTGQSAAPTTLTTWVNSQILRKELILMPNTTLSLNDLKLVVPAGAATGYYSLKLAVGYPGASIWQTLSESWNGFQKLQ